MMYAKWTPAKGPRCANPFFSGLFDGRNAQDRETQEKRLEDDSRVSWYPAADIYNTKEDYVVKVELPGLGKKDVDIEVNDDILSVKGERKEEKNDKSDGYRRYERYHGKFHRAFRLPRDVDAEKIAASMKDGILELRIARPEEKKPVNIPISLH